MGILSKKANEFKEKEMSQSLGRITSDTAVDIIKKLNGSEDKVKSTIVDNFIVFTNASGGCGTSTIVNNVAYEASKKGLKVIVIDLNILCPTQHIYLNIKQSATEQPDLVSYLTGKTTLGESIDTSHKYSLMYANNRNIADLINCNEEVAIINFNDMISKFRNLFDLILIDCPMNLDSMLCNNTLYSCDTIYLVWDEGIGSIANTDRLRRNMAYCGMDSYTKMRVILNKRTNIHYSFYPFKKLNIELVQTLPFDTAIIESSVFAQTFCEKGSSSSKNAIEFARGIIKLTDKVLRIGGLIE